MARGVAICVVLFALLIGGLDASARSAALRLRVAPSRINAGGSVLVIAGVSPARALCSGTVSHAPKTFKLAARKALGGAVSWTAKIPSTAPGGMWTVRVACAHAGSATAHFFVTAQPPPPPPPPPTIPAKVVVVKAGLSSGPGSFKDETAISWGVVLQNASPDEDALDVELTLNFIDANGLTVRSRTTFTGYDIPAGATYYVGDYYVQSSTVATPVRLDVASVQIGKHQRKSIGGLPQVANVRASDFATGYAHVQGDFGNPYGKTISSAAPVTVVAFDAAGNVIGGGTGNPNASVTPGARTGFDVSIRSLIASQIASVQVSVAPVFTS